ncbi:MAG: DUF1015 domain-containing protein [Dehalococcoidia bacterium]
MADVQPFKGLRYNQQKVHDLSMVITPPYDVISPEQQRIYYERNPYNLIRLELGMDFADDSPTSNRYTRAAETLHQWIQENVLIREDKPSFYLMEHRFTRRMRETSYWGLIATVRLEEFDTGHIRATEITMDSPVEDRLNLLRSCRVNLSPTMGAFIQKEGDLLSLLPDIDTASPHLSGTDDFGVTFNVWVVNEDSAVRRIIDFFNDKPIYIADGHHRYRTSMTYRKEQLGTENVSDDPRNFVMMTLISSNDHGLTMLPTHRLVSNLTPEQLDTLRTDLPEYFSIQELAASPPKPEENLDKWMNALSEAGYDRTAFGLYGLEPDKYLLLIPHDVSQLYQMLPGDRPLAWRKLDVSLLHGIILQRILGIDTPEKEKESLEYSPDEEMVLGKVISGEAQLAMFLNPAPISSVMAVADAGDRMPQKSTYFYPKTAAGLVMNPLW